MPHSEQLVERLVLEHPRLDEAARAPELLVKALRRPGYYGLALRMVRDWGAALTDAVVAALLARRRKAWFAILDADTAVAAALADALCAREPRLKYSAASEDLLLATLSRDPATNWRKALRILNRGARVTDAVRDLLLRPLHVQSGTADLPFDDAAGLDGAAVLESEHPYRATRVDDRKPVSLPGATDLYVKFDPRSRTLDRYAYVQVLRPEASPTALPATILAGPYCRDHFAGLKDTPADHILADSIIVRFCTDGDQNAPNPLWGWKLVVYAAHVAPNATLWSTLNRDARCRPLVAALATLDPVLAAAASALRDAP